MPDLLHRESDICYYFGNAPRAALTTGNAAPWPFCLYRAMPHDAHMANERNTWCDGKAGVLAPAPNERKVELISYWAKVKNDAIASIEAAVKRAEDAQQRIDDLMAPPLGVLADLGYI